MRAARGFASFALCARACGPSLARGRRGRARRRRGGRVRARARLRGASCHAIADLAGEPAPQLEQVGARLYPSAIEAALAAGPRLPDCLAGLPKGERAAARTELTHLASLGGPLVSASGAQRCAHRRARAPALPLHRRWRHAPFGGADTLAKPLWEFPRRQPAVASPAKPAPSRVRRDLTGIASRTSLEALARDLQDPLAADPPAACPRSLSAGEAGDIAAYLFTKTRSTAARCSRPVPGSCSSPTRPTSPARPPTSTRCAGAHLGRVELLRGRPAPRGRLGFSLPRADRGPGRGSVPLRDELRRRLDALRRREVRGRQPRPARDVRSTRRGPPSSRAGTRSR